MATGYAGLAIGLLTALGDDAVTDSDSGDLFNGLMRDHPIEIATTLDQTTGKISVDAPAIDNLISEFTAVAKLLLDELTIATGQDTSEILQKISLAMES